MIDFILFLCLAGCSVADLEEALKTGLDSGIQKNLDKHLVAACKNHGVTWSSAPSSALVVIEYMSPVMIELLRKCRNSAIPGKKLDQALLSIHRSHTPISTNACFDLASAEDMSRCLRQLFSKVRKCKEAEMLLGS